MAPKTNKKNANPKASAPAAKTSPKKPTAAKESKTSMAASSEVELTAVDTPYLRALDLFDQARKNMVKSENVKMVINKIIAPLLDWLETAEKTDRPPSDYSGISAFNPETYKSQMQAVGKYTCLVPMHWIGLDAPGPVC